MGRSSGCRSAAESYSFYFLLLGESVGLVPASHVDSVVIRGVEVVRLDIGAVVPVCPLHRGDDFRKESESRTSVVLMVPVGVDVQLVALPHLVLIQLDVDVAKLPLRVQVTDEVNRTRGQLEHDGGMIADAERPLHAILGEDRLHLAGDGLLLGLIHVRHLLCFSV